MTAIIGSGGWRTLGALALLFAVGFGGGFWLLNETSAVAPRPRLRELCVSGPAADQAAAIAALGGSDFDGREVTPACHSRPTVAFEPGFSPFQPELSSPIRRMEASGDPFDPLRPDVDIRVIDPASQVYAELAAVDFVIGSAFVCDGDVCYIERSEVYVTPDEIRSGALVRRVRAAMGLGN